MNLCLTSQIEKYNKTGELEWLYELDDIITKLRQSKYISEDMSLLIGLIDTDMREFCEENNVCQNCFSQMRNKPVKEIHTELDSRDCELIDNYMCPQCNDMFR